MPPLDPIRLTLPLRGVRLSARRPPRLYTGEEMEKACAAARQEGHEEASKLQQVQLGEHRAEMVQLQDGALRALRDQHEALAGQFRRTLPELALDIARHLLADLELDGAAIARIVEDTLAEVVPGREGLTVLLNERDLALLEKTDAAFRARHPDMAFRADASLRSGDCVVRSRFGEIDARLDTKLRNVALTVGVPPAGGTPAPQRPAAKKPAEVPLSDEKPAPKPPAAKKPAKAPASDERPAPKRRSSKKPVQAPAAISPAKAKARPRKKAPK